MQINCILVTHRAESATWLADKCLYNPFLKESISVAEVASFGNPLQSLIALNWNVLSKAVVLDLGILKKFRDLEDLVGSDLYFIGH